MGATSESACFRSVAVVTKRILLSFGTKSVMVVYVELFCSYRVVNLSGHHKQKPTKNTEVFGRFLFVVFLKLTFKVS